tara:strand:+ start:754 stop:888 length:135 start_codon:yes stop_codon:yes gene_type:complete
MRFFTKYQLQALVHVGDADGVVTMLEDQGYEDDAEYVRETYFKK